jgi:hypothetical protein
MSDTVGRNTPLSVRLTAAERSNLLARAGGRTLSAYVKAVLFHDAPVTAARGHGLALADRTLLAHLLATLGGSGTAPNLELLAREAEAGNLFCDGLTAVRLRQACDDVRLMHDALMRGLGTKPRDELSQERRVARAFNALNGHKEH